MKKYFIYLSLIIIAGLLGCGMLPKLDADKLYPDKGRIVHRIGDDNCRFLIATEHYGIHETGTYNTYNYDECRTYKPGMAVLVEIYNQGQVRILGYATP